MSTTHFTGPVASANGFINTITGATVVTGSDSSIIQRGSLQVILTSAQVLTMFTTPVSILAAPGINKSIYVESVVLYKPAGTAYTIGSATNITVGYASGTALTGTQAVTGFLDQATAQTRLLMEAITSITPTANTGLTIRLAGADVTVGTSTLGVVVNYVIIPTVLS